MPRNSRRTAGEEEVGPGAEVAGEPSAGGVVAAAGRVRGAAGAGTVVTAVRSPPAPRGTSTTSRRPRPATDPRHCSYLHLGCRFLGRHSHLGVRHPRSARTGEARCAPCNDGRGRPTTGWGCLPVTVLDRLARRVAQLFHLVGRGLLPGLVVVAEPLADRPHRAQGAEWGRRPGPRRRSTRTRAARPVCTPRGRRGTPGSLARDAAPLGRRHEMHEHPAGGLTGPAPRDRSST